MGNADWVKNRHECTLDRLFQELLEGAGECVETRNQQAAEGGNLIFNVDPPREDAPLMFYVKLAERDMMNRELRVRFMLETHQISVEGMSGVSTNLTVTVQIGDETGERQVLVQGRADLDMVDVPVWQVLRAALEELFFDVAVA